MTPLWIPNFSEFNSHNSTCTAQAYKWIFIFITRHCVWQRRVKGTKESFGRICLCQHTEWSTRFQTDLLGLLCSTWHCTFPGQPARLITSCWEGLVSKERMNWGEKPPSQPLLVVNNVWAINQEKSYLPASREHSCLFWSSKGLQSS